ncbi:uncharacterized protein LOC105848289 isoform X1 [Hydra vulgaris]|uniref:uncharacterized protein LOC105848289 isoform X1 n=1 Tax=Hydra vulgaris TaxID=6087 RepID=UPI001F5F226A|nr:uncharacterized protein LOC105848289 isoform X1 [Hydra vulgaris]XP_047145043.1 uncharacterized protein LOC105848289 isoform X1 [Hydra vulgaris]XP_047145044.1 uncharacterized protein LOC105848289 isoform X1 [Hydra vulgaris]
MSSKRKCCGCWTLIQSFLKKGQSRSYVRNKYNEKEFNVEFESLLDEDHKLEEKEFNTPSQNIITDVEKDLLLKRKFNELLNHQNELNVQQEEQLKQKEENARLEDEAFIQAKMEASRRSKEKPFDKSRLPNMKSLNSVQFAKWLSEENIDVTSPDFDLEDFDDFLEKANTKSAQNNGYENTFHRAFNVNDEEIKITNGVINSLQPVELYAVQKKSECTQQQQVAHQSNNVSFNTFIYNNMISDENGLNDTRHLNECVFVEEEFVITSSNDYDELIN